MQALESLLREEFRSDSFVGTSAEEVLAAVGAAHRRRRRSAVAGAVAVLLVTAGALLLPGTARSPSTPVRPPAIAGIDSANADAVVNNLEKAGMNPNGPWMINAADGYGRFSGCPTGIPAQRCVPYWAITTDGGRTFRALKTPSLDLNYMYMFDAEHLVLDESGPDWPTSASGLRAVSSDGGRTWRYIGRTVAGTVTSLPADTQLIAVPATGTESGIGVLYPDGSTRRLTTVPPDAHIVLEIGPVSDVYLLVTTSGTLLVSTDAGFTWQARTLPWKGYRTFFVLGSTSGQLFISTEMAGPDPGDVFASGDNGVTWGRIAWPVDRGPLAPTTRTLVDGSKRTFVWANYSGVVVDHLGLCLSDGATLWCRIGTAFVRVPGVRPLIAQGGGLLFTLGGTVDHPVLYSSSDARRWTRVRMLD